MDKSVIVMDDFNVSLIVLVMSSKEKKYIIKKLEQISVGKILNPAIREYKGFHPYMGNV